MPDCGVHYLWFALVCLLIRSHPPSEIGGRIRRTSSICSADSLGFYILPICSADSLGVWDFADLFCRFVGFMGFRNI